VIVIDAGGWDSASQRAALTVSDVYLIPFSPTSFDVWSMGMVSRVINDVRAVHDFHSFAFLNKAWPRGNDNQEALGILREEEAWQTWDVTLKSRKAWSNMTGQGLSVLESRDKKAITEFNELCVNLTSFQRQNNL
jgi:chromosome partitioning protein